MIDFACKRFDIDEIVKCSLSLTKSEYKLLRFFIENSGKEFNSSELTSSLKLDLTTVQKGVKKIYSQKIIIRHQKNLSGGGYVYNYEVASKKKIREIINKIINSWSEKVKENISKW